MKRVKKKTFINDTDITINEFLASIPEEDVISTHFAVYGYENCADEWTVIFYKEEIYPLHEVQGND